MPTERQAEVRQMIKRLCKGKFLTTSQIAEHVGLSVNTIRAHYVYPMVADGELKKRTPHTTLGQAYTTA